ncbi:hypothetical protein HZC31_04870 [Candidatus Woesearchaeota archaeon]|nr:hypothetical protein [Candidatus Woesearchaeota archaeon]
MQDINFEKILEKLHLESSFFLFGGIGFLLSIYAKYELGLQSSLLTFIFGGFFRLINIITKNVFKLSGMVARPRFYLMTFVRFLIWAVALFIYAWLINRVINIF